MGKQKGGARGVGGPGREERRGWQLGASGRAGGRGSLSRGRSWAGARLLRAVGSSAGAFTLTTNDDTAKPRVPSSPKAPCPPEHGGKFPPQTESGPSAGICASPQFVYVRYIHQRAR